VLVLTRKEHERINIGNNIVVVVDRIMGGKVRIGIEAPADVLVLRSELAPDNREQLPRSIQPKPASSAGQVTTCFGLRDQVRKQRFAAGR
jgi:carbon storage regulator